MRKGLYRYERVPWKFPLQIQPQCLGWMDCRKEWEEEGDLRYSSIRLRSDLIYANSGGGADHGSIGDVLTTLEYPAAADATLFGCF